MVSKQRLEDCMDAIIDYRGKTPQKTAFGIPLITAKIIKKGRILPVSEYIAEEDYDSWMRRGIPSPGDIVLTTEAPLGEVAQLDDRKIALAQRVITLRGKKGLLDNTFLKYLLMTREVQHQLDGRGTGTTVKGIKQSELREVILSFPQFSEQKAIAHVLGSLDDRIELNRRMNETLEGMAQALFKSWFVDFDPVLDNAIASGKEIPPELKEKATARSALGDKRHPLAKEIRTLFPNQFTYSDKLGWIPKGWEVKTFIDLISIIGGGTPKTSIEEYWNGDIPWFSVVDAPNPSDVFVIDTEKHITPLGVDKSSTKILSIGTTIISARGTVGKCAIVGKPMAMNQSCYGIIGNGGISDTFIYFTTKQHVERLQKGGHGSVFNTITRNTFQTIKMAFGNEEITQQFETCIKSFLDKILNNNIENVNLIKLRDTLLPKLLSGEIRIPDAEKMVEGIKG